MEAWESPISCRVSDVPFQLSDKALVLFSGGQDSTTCLAWALARYGEKQADLFCPRNGQRELFIVFNLVSAKDDRRVLILLCTTAHAELRGSGSWCAN